MYAFQSQAGRNKILEERWEMGRRDGENHWVIVTVKYLRKILPVKSPFYLADIIHHYFKEELY